VTDEEVVAVESVRGRPRLHAEPRTNITVTLLVRHVGYLDLMSLGIWMRHQKSIPRAELVRAFVEFMEHSEIDFSQFATMNEMIAHLAELWREIPRAGRLRLLLESTLFHPQMRARTAVETAGGASE
jgi:hypothetical protein